MIKNFRETYGLSVIPVSVDGVINPMLPDSRTDRGQAEQLGVKFFPAMMLVNPKSGGEASQLRLYQSGRPGETVPLCLQRL